ncbi:MAG: DUF87 domain-containing protein [Candidatus Pacearchaeota archaeon]|jgi:hypothetical protein
MHFNKNSKEALDIAKKEIRKAKIEKFVFLFFLFLTLISCSFLVVFLSSKLMMTGYASYIEGRAGYITELNITQTFIPDYWSGVYGLSLRVPGYFSQIIREVPNSEIVEAPSYFDCIQTDALGGPEIYATTASSIDFNSLRPATLAELDSYVGCSGSFQCPSNTFTSINSYVVGTNNITDVPSTYTYRFDGNQGTFDVGALNDSVNLVFVSHLAAIQKGYSSTKTVNFQMLLPTLPNTTVDYYFFNDPNDECPAGGIGNNINASVYGYSFDIYNNTLPNVTVTVAGYSAVTDSNGFYNFSFTVSPGVYNLIAQLAGYDPYFDNVSVTFSENVFERNITMVIITPGMNDTISPIVDGFVWDESLIPISGANVSMSGTSNVTDSNGYYSISPIIFPGLSPIIAINEGYNNYFYFLSFDDNTTYINHNITMTVASTNYQFPTGPYTSGPYTTGPYPQQFQPQIIQAKKNGEDFWISTKEIRKEVRQNTFVDEKIGLFNFKTSTMNMLFSLSPNLQDFVKIDKTSVVLNPNSFADVTVTIYGTKPLGVYNGSITVSGDVQQTIPVHITVVEKRSLVEALLMQIDVFNKIVRPGDTVKYKLSLQNLLREQGYKVFLKIYLTESNGTTIYATDNDEVEILNSLTLLKELKLPDNITEGDYLLNVDATYLNLFSSVTAPVKITKPIYLYSFLGMPLWLWFSLISFFSFILLNFLIYKYYKEKKKRYKIFLDYNTLPKPGTGVVRLGNIAETKVPAYYELERLTTHCIVAGATGMGKSISAQVIIEEALMNNIAVIVMDPTAQWSGMLRKCTDKKMMSFYPKFGLKETDARAFKGNVKQIRDAKEIIDITKYMTPGQIQIFSMNKLDPKDIDIFVANFIRQIFRSDPKESPTLKVLLVFDEVHRLLSKFGGSGEGFLQVERSCREFRKWGLGVMLISQVLNDFVGEIKANINTEVQARTLEESDLDRIKTKYGEEYLKSLVRAEVGVAMFQNAEYNRGRPYFLNFRPILHNTRRLPDEELEKYNKYNFQVEDLEYQIEQLEKEKLDVFDLKMELKLVKDKIMTGNFSVVEIYLEGLVPRVAKEWEKLGKQPKKLQTQLLSEEEIKKAMEQEKKEKEALAAKEEKKVEAKPIEKPVETQAVKQTNPATNKTSVNIVKPNTSILQQTTKPASLVKPNNPSTQKVTTVIPTNATTKPVVLAKPVIPSAPATKPAVVVKPATPVVQTSKPTVITKPAVQSVQTTKLAETKKEEVKK